MALQPNYKHSSTCRMCVAVIKLKSTGSEEVFSFLSKSHTNILPIVPTIYSQKSIGKWKSGWLPSTAGSIRRANSFGSSRMWRKTALTKSTSSQMPKEKTILSTKFATCSVPSWIGKTVRLDQSFPCTVCWSIWPFRISLWLGSKRSSKRARCGSVTYITAYKSAIC